MTMKSSTPYWKMTPAQLRDATREYDDPNYVPKDLPKTPAERVRG